VNWRSYTEEFLDSCGAFREAVLAILAVIAKTGTHPPLGARPGCNRQTSAPRKSR
jgi:hypothetical protein